MSDTSWRSQLEKSLEHHRNMTEARYLQLATLTQQNRPANRTVVFRGFYEYKDCLKFAVDSRSEKVNQIAVQPWAEACWYFTQTRAQAAFTICFVKDRAMADFSVFFLDNETFAGCR